MEAREIMTRDVVTLAPDMSVTEAQDALLHYRIHGAPVVDDAGQMIGMVSFTDLSSRPGRKVREVMTPDPLSVGEDTTVEDVAALMLDQMVRRVPVVEGGRVVGMVSASDIIQVFLNLHERTPRGNARRAGPGAVVEQAPRRTVAVPRRAPRRTAVTGGRRREGSR
ncbi:MAG TPA: CBS domain-containing protein [bacterium]|nr:CBS domain-containing protein [bacterium]